MRHAFIFLGDKTLFMCHQVMLTMREHNREAIFEIELDDEVRATLIAERRKYGATHFLANAEQNECTLMQMQVEGEVRDMDIWNFFPDPADWGDQWPWKDQPRFPRAKVRIVRPVHYLSLDERPPVPEFESYLLFGRDEEAHLFHSVRNRPDYDHVATLRSVPAELRADALLSGVGLEFLDLPLEEGITHCSNPLPDGLYRVQTEAVAHPFYIDVARTYWFSTLVVNGPNPPCRSGGNIPVFGERVEGIG